MDKEADITQEFYKGQIVVQNGMTCVVVGLPGDDLPGEGYAVPDDHLALWYGGSRDGMPEVWTVPAEYVEPTIAAWRVLH